VSTWKRFSVLLTIPRKRNSSTPIATKPVYTGNQEVRPVYDDVIAEPRLDKKLLIKSNANHQMFPHDHHSILLKTRKQMLL
jgi:hypothetical protein